MRKSTLFAFVVVAAAVIGGVSWYAFDRARQAREVHALLAAAREQREVLHDDSQALVLLRKALGIDASEWEVHYEIGRASLALEHVGEAVESLERALALAPEKQLPGVHVVLGQAYRKRYKGSGQRRDYQLAVASFREAMLDPELEAEALEHLGMLALADRDFARARQYFSDLVERAPEYERREEIDRALTLLESIEQKQG